MNIDVEFSISTLDPRKAADKTVAVIDVFRAATTIVEALFQGAMKILPVLTPAEAHEAKSNFPDALLGGEQGGEKIPGFDLGNSPLEYSQEAVSGKTIIFLTTNGTKAIRSIYGAADVLLVSFPNIRAAIKRINIGKHDLLILCAGTQGAFSLEDACAAGCLIHHLQHMQDCFLTDSAIASCTLYKAYAHNLLKYLSHSKNGRVLAERNRQSDIAYCCRHDQLDIVPIYDLTERAITGPVSPIGNPVKKGENRFNDQRAYNPARSG